MDPLLAIGLFVGVPVGLAIVITIAVMVPRKYSGVDVLEDEATSGSALITSSRAVPNPAALPAGPSARIDDTGGVHGTF